VPDYARIYARQEYLTPGAPRTIELIADAVAPTEDSLLLDLASGKGEAASTLAGRFACRIVCIDTYDPFIHYAAAKFWFFNLRDLVSMVRADGRHLPLRNGAFDAAYCIGAPSIVGLQAALVGMAAAVRPGGHVIASDIVWRTKPETGLGPEWRWLANPGPRPSLDEYAAEFAAAGLQVQRTLIHPVSDWEDYWRPMLEVANEAKTTQPADIFLADEIESGVDLERRALEQFIDYATFIARKPNQTAA
jgi:SAM-dependent methyltransferase